MRSETTFSRTPCLNCSQHCNLAAKGLSVEHHGIWLWPAYALDAAAAWQVNSWVADRRRIVSMHFSDALSRCSMLQTGGQAPPVGYGDGATPGVAPPQSADKALPDFFSQVEAIKVRQQGPSGPFPDVRSALCSFSAYVCPICVQARVRD